MVSSTKYISAVDAERRCAARTEPGRQCPKHPLAGQPFCAAHGGVTERARILSRMTNADRSLWEVNGTRKRLSAMTTQERAALAQWP
jgi:hypothetical protein